ncbi:MAG: 3-hydroxyacyl-CoA dehydrogenase NAD-binding domain-containing protein, partial [Chitinophagaceae bacterium]
MENNLKNRESILVAGNGRILYSISACLLRAGHLVVLFTEDTDGAIKRIQMHYKDLSGLAHKSINPHSLEVTNRLNNNIPYQLVIAVTGENIEEKRNLIHLIEKKAPNDAIIAINTESIPLSALQEGCNYPGRIIGANWAEPAHTTFFLELIINKIADRKYADRLFYLAKNYWNKDPYLVLNDTGIRARMFAAMMREALYLVKNEYASVEDIDRACRNDAGYYLPFAGNCRYMDLMGTYAYGMVMQELNP